MLEWLNRKYCTAYKFCVRSEVLSPPGLYINWKSVVFWCLCWQSAALRLSYLNQYLSLWLPSDKAHILRYNIPVHLGKINCTQHPLFLSICRAPKWVLCAEQSVLKEKKKVACSRWGCKSRGKLARLLTAICGILNSPDGFRLPGEPNQAQTIYCRSILAPALFSKRPHLRSITSFHLILKSIFYIRSHKEQLSSN